MAFCIKHDELQLQLETAIKTAQDANVSANREKLKWQEKINELNIYKKILQDKENLLILRAKELEYLTQVISKNICHALILYLKPKVNILQSVLTKKEEGMKVLKNAKHLENQNKEKFNQLQIQIQALMEREKKIATERYNTTKYIYIYIYMYLYIYFTEVKLKFYPLMKLKHPKGIQMFHITK